MKKRILFPFLALLLTFQLQAQPKAHEGTADFQRTTQPAAIIELPYANNVVEKALEEYMSKKGLRGSDSRDYRVFRGYKMSSSADHSSDLYFKVERKSRREKDMCTLYLVIGKNGEDVKTRTDGGKASLDGATGLLDDMVPSIEAYSLELQIQEQEEQLKKNQKKYDNLVEDSVDYVKKIKSLQDKMTQNRRDRESQQAELKKQHDILDLLKGKRKS